MDELLGELNNGVILCPISMNPYNISVLETIMQTILEHISHNTSFYYAMLIEENRIYPFRAKMEKIIKDKLNEGWNPTAANFSLVSL